MTENEKQRCIAKAIKNKIHGRFGDRNVTIVCSNAVDPANPVNKWGYRGVPGKGGKTHNATIVPSKLETETNN